MRIRLFFLSLITVISISATDLPALEAYNQKALHDWQLPGFSIAIVQDDKILLAKGYGVRELNKPEPVTEHTLFGIASNTKAFTTAALAILVHQNKLKWDDRVQTHLPYFQIFDDPWISHEARLDDLLCHRLGFRTFSGDLIWWNTAYTAEEVVRRARYLKPQTGFRRAYGYSNIAFIAAGEVIAHASGDSWSNFLRREILNPLGMTNTALSVNELTTRPDVATAHAADDDGKPRPIPWQPWNNVAAAGGVVSSAADLAQWLRLQLNLGIHNDHTFWTPREAWRMWSIHTPIHLGPDGDRDITVFGAGLGWFVADYRGELLIRHGGALDGMYSHTVMAPKKKIGIVVLSNGMNALSSSIAYNALDNLLGRNDRDWSAENLKKAAEARDKKRNAQKAETEKRLANTKPSLPLENYAAKYGGPMFGDATIAHENNKLVLRIHPNPELTADLVHWQHDVFEVKWHKKHAWFGDGKLQFVLNEKSEATEFKMHVPNEDFWFEELEFKKLK
jgi:CubicO group peptidase (beta-lactamase class C family)